MCPEEAGIDVIRHYATRRFCRNEALPVSDTTRLRLAVRVFSVAIMPTVLSGDGDWHQPPD
jgi:hypothetical protein